MDWIMIWKTVLIGIVEGLTEFLPVSSTGHMILAEEVLHFQGPPGKVFEIVIQLGAILAICVLYRAKIMLTVSGVLKREPVATRFATAVIVAFLPAAVVGVALHKYIKALLDKSVDDIDWKTALFIGVCQCLAMVPGVSRSGSTIMAARAFRVDRAAAAEFSFFLAIPTMLGATVYDLMRNWSTLDWHGGGLILLGMAVAFVSALVVVQAFVAFISRHGFGVFAWYRIVVGALALVLLLAR